MALMLLMRELAPVELQISMLRIDLLVALIQLLVRGMLSIGRPTNRHKEHILLQGLLEVQGDGDAG